MWSARGSFPRKSRTCQRAPVEKMSKLLWSNWRFSHYCVIHHWVPVNTSRYLFIGKCQVLVVEGKANGVEVSIVTIFIFVFLSWQLVGLLSWCHLENLLTAVWAESGGKFWKLRCLNFNLTTCLHTCDTQDLWGLWKLLSGGIGGNSF